MNPRAKLILVILSVLLLGLAVWVIATSLSHIGKARLDISVAPTDAVVKLDGHSVKSGSVYVTPGQHSLTASRQNFKDASQSLNAKKGSNQVFLILAPANQAGLDYLNSHPDQQRLREQLAAKQVNQIQISLQAKYPILKDLPVDTRRFNIDYGVSLAHPDDPTAIALYVTSAPEDRSLATDWLKYKGYDPAKFEIIYKDK